MLICASVRVEIYAAEKVIFQILFLLKRFAKPIVVKRRAFHYFNNVIFGFCFETNILLYE